MARKSRKQHNAKVNDDCNREQKICKTAVYVRLSSEDMRKKASESIDTQKAMLLEYIKEQPDLRLYDVYEDVNYTGTNFKRPGFVHMLEEIQTGLIDCVLVKDLSRLGRSFVETGYFLEHVFPLLGVRFVSLDDHYDSLKASLDEGSLIVPLKNLMNEIYARDISRKIQSSVRLKQKRGQFVGPIAPYGYIKHGHAFIVDAQTAPVVRQIFTWISEGLSDAAIAKKLNDRQIMSPNRYRFEKGIIKAAKYEKTCFWHKSAIKRISENPAYTGVMAQGKYRSNFLYGGGIMHTNNDEWIIVKDTHTPIIDAEIFEAVQRLRKTRKQCSVLP